MNVLTREVKILLRGYISKGGKDNRRQQSARILAFANFCFDSGVHSTGQIGKSHVIGYWKANRELADSTLYNHWRAICVFWERTGKTGQPPKPYGKEELAQKSDVIP